VTQALYRRYRPETFDEVIGQEHVTEPLMQALRADKVTHAYLFSGPRGCGKTTSARILARCLNCEQGPTPTPCGTCDSCVELGLGGSGSLDVVEIDAASHNGVDDARDLRERAAFAPARDRYKVFILDEAHMVTPQGFNALLKIVEEPPPHVKFIFATTEPDKVIGTIRSRTHHYPFRLVAPDTLLPYLEQICASEGVAVGSGVLPLVVRAGGGSVRDSLSVLDQLIAGADAGGLDYESSVALLGYTHAALLDDVVGAISTRDGASAFRVVDRVISSGHEPRRFIEDLLERLRDLIVIAASGESARAALRDLPADQLDRMRAQAGALGSAELSRSADLVNTALSEMTGATSPRLHLELLVARLLLPAVDDGGVVARLERVERVVEGGVAARGGTPAVTSQVAQPPQAAQQAPAAQPAPAAPAEPARVEQVAPEAAPAAVPAPAAREPEPAREPAVREPAVREPAQPVASPSAPAASSAVAPQAEMVRRRWPEVLQTLRGMRMASWVLVSENAQVATVEDGAVKLSFSTPQLAQTFRTGPHSEHVRRAVLETLGFDARIEPVLGSQGVTSTSRTESPSAGSARDQAAASWNAPARPRSEPRSATRARPPAPRPEVASDGVPDGPEPSDEPDPGDHGEPRAVADRSAAPARPASATSGPGREAPEPSGPATPADQPAVLAPPAEADRPAPRPRPAARPTAAARPNPSPRPAPSARQRPPAPDDGSDASPDDPELAGSGLVGAPLVAQMLGGTVIDEIPDPPA
jgi:DNA polymerase-3 subunit gamma/tau